MPTIAQELGSLMNWRILFWAAAVFNWAAGLPFLLFPDFALQMVEIVPPPDLAFHRLSGLLIACFGLIYASVARDLDRYRPLVSIAVIGKVGVAAIFGVSWMQGFAPPRALAIASADFLFGIAFLTFLLVGPKPATDRT